MSTEKNNDEEPNITPGEVVEDVLAQTFRAGRVFKASVVALSILLALGIVGFVMRVSDGFSDHTAWGYYAALFSFLLTTTQSALIVSIAMRLARNNWRRPVSRASELFAVVGIFNLLVFIPMIMILPADEGRSSLWFEWPQGGPHFWDTVSFATLVFCGIGLLYVSSLPDLAVIRDRSAGWRQTFAKILTPFWRGTQKQWLIMNIGLGVLGALYFILLIFNHTMISSDMAMSLVPGWRDALFPTYHAVTSLQAGLATVIVVLFVLKKYGGFDKYIHMEQFWAMSKLLLALSLMWFYFWFSGFIILWYGRQPIEQNILTLFMVGPYKSLFIASFLLNFVVPVLMLIWNMVRKSIVGPTIVAGIILVGSLIDRIRIYVASYSIEDVFAHTMESVPAAHTPDIFDIFILIGGISGAILVYILAAKVIPVVSIWEVKEGMLYTVVRPFLRRKVTVIGKPD